MPNACLPLLRRAFRAHTHYVPHEPAPARVNDAAGGGGGPHRPVCTALKVKGKCARSAVHRPTCAVAAAVAAHLAHLVSSSVCEALLDPKRSKVRSCP